MARNQEFYWRRLHSLLGVIPVGLFLIMHLVINNFAVRGEEAYNQATQFMESIPYLIFLEVFVIYLPLIFHAIYGIYIAFTAKNNTGRFGFFRNWMFKLQRWTGVITLIFLAWHIWETRIAKAFGAEVNFQMMVDILASPFMFAFYVIGILSAIFHFANGLWSFLVSWGITVTPRSQVISTYVTIGVFIILSIMGISTLVAFI
ncbi:succinate dehydrogenase cytochrome b558 subunit [Bacillus sp. B15-48]|uniref:succinate dehydrogenase cytochrome b558 subunit n=1 Tax=Bacillus sp. B15-48 TaxID=1548601 RepID=UPI00193FC6F4|nr:succinate dehydrogenase cytochrome b558 subunit [Bacillus sp. B15-48]MBM4762487.1 succinate dehydrogenase [Bacillus sp. B15-48]